MQYKTSFFKWVKGFIKYYVMRIRDWFRYRELMKKPKVERTFERIRTNDNSIWGVEKIKDWQNRQLQEFEPTELKTKNLPITYSVMQKIQRDMIINIEYITDKKLWDKSDHWATIYETLELGKSDCEEQGFVVMYNLILHNKYDPDKMGVAFVYIPEEKDSGHIFAIYQDEPDDFWLIDNGHYFSFPIKASEFLNRRPEIKFVNAFNFETFWKYKNL